MALAKKRYIRFVGTALLAATIVVLQWLSSAVTAPLGFTISLVLIPILVGGVLFGVASSAFLGFISGAWILILSFIGVEPSGVFFLSVNVPMTVLTIILKGTLAGLVSGLLYKALSGKNHDILAMTLAGGSVAVVNTGVFLVFALTFFRDSLSIEAGFAKGVSYVVATVIGINFIVEFFSTAILGTLICKALKKSVK